MSLSFILTDLQGAPHGDILSANEKKLVLPHMRVPSASFKMPLEDALADFVMNTDCLLKCYRDDPYYGTRTLEFNGPVISAEEVGELNSHSIAITAAGPFWRLTKRIIPATTEPSFWFGAGRVLSEHAVYILNSINTEDYTGISVGTHTPSTQSGSIEQVWLKSAGEQIVELHAGADSFEFVVEPIEPVVVGGGANWPQIGSMHLAPRIGEDRDNAVFEYGTGDANIATYSRSVGRDGMLTRAYVSVSGWPLAPVQGKNLIVREDAAAITARGLFEEQVPEGGLVDDDLRTALGDYHLAIRKQPREILTFRPRLNAFPSALTDYHLGDTVRARIVIADEVRYDGQVRVWGITISEDQNANELVELELVAP